MDNGKVKINLYLFLVKLLLSHWNRLDQIIDILIQHSEIGTKMNDLKGKQ